MYNLNIELIDIYNDDEYFKKLIKHLYKRKKRLLQLNEIVNIFKFHLTTISKKIKKLNLSNYFEIQDSDLELQFKSFLESNNLFQCQNNKITNKGDFIRKEKRILSKNKDTGGQPEIDFYLKNYNIGFEINDINTHNSKKKDINYHLNKTLQCNKKDIRLIHLWEWELTDPILWARTSSWILNLLNSNKINIDINQCEIKKVPVDQQKDFLEKYSLNGYIQNDVSLGVYNNNELIQLLSYNIIDDNQYNILSFCTKFGYNIDNKFIINHLKEICNSPSSIFIYCDISKFTDKMYNDIGFKLLEFEKPSLISYNENEVSDYKKIHNCGKNVYILNN